MYVCGAHTQRNITQPLKKEMTPFTAMWTELNEESERDFPVGFPDGAHGGYRPANAGNAEDSVWEDPLE